MHIEHGGVDHEVRLAAELPKELALGGDSIETTHGPSACSGLGRRIPVEPAHQRFVGFASRNTTRGWQPMAVSSSIADRRSEVNALLRTSDDAGDPATPKPPTADRGIDHRLARMLGGRLSTTNQPRSSRDFAAVLRPAPDKPEMIAISSGAA